MQIHLSNSTTQNIVFFYRDPNTNLLHNAEIPSGRQVTIGRKNWTAGHADKVVRQVQAFGGHDAAEVHGKIERFHGLLYRVDGIIEAEEIVEGNEHVKVMQNDRSVEQAVNSVLATDRAVNVDKGRRRVKRTEIEVAQLVPQGSKPTGDEVHFTVAVDPEGADKIVKRAITT